jgi:HD-like signal output (HDOD) protein
LYLDRKEIFHYYFLASSFSGKNKKADMAETFKEKQTDVAGRILFFNVDQNFKPILKKTFDDAGVIVFESGDLKAEKIIENEKIGIVLCDCDTEYNDSVRLLTHVREKNSSIYRIAILKTEMHKKAVFLVFKGIANSTLEKPHGLVDLMSHILHIFEIRKILEDKQLLELLSQIENLIALPQTYYKFAQALEKNRPISEIVDILENDISISTKILQIANSAFFREKKIASLENAVKYLGQHNVKNIVTIFCYNSTEKLEAPQNQVFKAIIKHSVRVNRELFSSYELRTGEKLSSSFATVGLTHDIGKIILLKYLPDRFNEIIQFQENNPKEDFFGSEINLGYGGCSHAEMGAYFLDLWNLPKENVQTSLYHHDYSEALESYKKMFEIFKDVNYDMEICDYTKMFEQT